MPLYPKPPRRGRLPAVRGKTHSYLPSPYRSLEQAKRPSAENKKTSFPRLSFCVRKPEFLAAAGNLKDRGRGENLRKSNRPYTYPRNPDRIHKKDLKWQSGRFSFSLFERRTACSGRRRSFERLRRFFAKEKGGRGKADYLPGPSEKIGCSGNRRCQRRACLLIKTLKISNFSDKY